MDNKTFFKIYFLNIARPTVPVDIYVISKKIKSKETFNLRMSSAFLALEHLVLSCR